MKDRLRLWLTYYLFWIVFFVVQKPLFMIWQYRLLGDVAWSDWFLVPWHGLPLDLSTAAYITVLYGLLLVASVWVRWSVIEKIADVITGILLTIALWVVLGDNGAFPSWGYHLDKDLFAYLQSPNEVLACAPWWLWAVGVIAFVALFTGWWFLYRYLFHKAPESSESIGKKIATTAVLIIVTALLFLPIRGSVTVSTMNTGRVYYSDNRMLNLAAVNPVFNIVESLSENRLDATRYTYMSDDECAAYVKRMLSDSCDTVEPLLTTTRPNIVLCILESFSSNAWEVMPNMQRLAAEGIYFDNVYANSYRTDRGVMAVLGAYPGCATTSVMMIPSKSQQLPQIGQVLQRNGYDLKFYYGGDEDFTNMRSYLVTGGFEQRVSDHDFPMSQRLSKWGVPDHILFDFAAKDIIRRNKISTVNYQLSTILSLSSHEPFEVDYHHYRSGFLNAVAYTDSCLGAFVDTLRTSPAWDSTLLVLIADHGYPYPEGVRNYEPQRYRIPLIFAGGAVKQPRVISTLCSQIDWLPTLLHQMQLDASDFIYAKDILSSEHNAFAYYNFVDGFAYIDSTGTTVIDAAVNKPLIETQPADDRANKAKAFTQHIMTKLSE